MSFLRHIEACNRHDLGRFRPWLVAGARVGWIRHDFAERLAAFPAAFEVAADAVRLSDDLATPAARTAAVQRVVEAVGLTRRIEPYPVAAGFGAPELLRIDRAVVAQFGVRAYGLHVNGFVRDAAGGYALWIGKRAKDKPVAPGKLDNIIAGGQPAGLGLAENLRKEAKEEAGLPDALIARCRPAGALTYCFENENGLKPDVLFVYDLELPVGFTPRNTDGEIESFHLMPAAEVAARIRAGDDFKFNVNLVITDFLIRHGLLDPESEPDYLAIVAGLRRPLP